MSLKNLTDSIKSEISGKSVSQPVPQNNDQKISVEREEVQHQKKGNEEEKRPVKRKKKADLVQKIYEYNNKYREELKQEEESGVFFIRLTERERRKLNLLNSVKLSNQAIGAYLVNEFLESQETKRILKSITDDLD